MFRKRHQRRVPGLNTMATSDISFMLLVFFLVTTSIDSDKGLARRLPPPPQDQQPTELVVKERDILRVAIGGDGRLTCEDRTVTLPELRERIVTFVDNAADSPSLPEKHIVNIPKLGRCSVTDRHVIALEVSREADYDTYFHVQQTITAAYDTLRGRLAVARFGHTLDECSPDERSAVMRHYPQRVSETEPEGKGGSL